MAVKGHSFAVRRQCLLLILLAVASLLSTGCDFIYDDKLEHSIYLDLSSYKSISGWGGADHMASIKAFKISCNKIMSYDKYSNISKYTELGGNAGAWQNVCERLEQSNIMSKAQAQHFLETWFHPYRISKSKNAESESLFTAYYQIRLKGSLTRTNRYMYPIYMLPRNPKYRGLDRASINAGSLQNRGLELAWVESLGKLYSMHLQGTGIVELEDGLEINLVYAGKNFKSYHPVHSALEKYGASLDSSRSFINWIDSNLGIAQRILEVDPSYVFFKRVNKPDNFMLGNADIRLTPKISIAADKLFYPMGTMLFVSSMKPTQGGINNTLFVIQDNGTLNQTPLHFDIFLGSNDEALAHTIKMIGNAYILFPKAINVPNHYTVSNNTKLYKIER